MSSVTNSEIISRPLMNVKARLEAGETAGNIVDPESANRTNRNPFVMTSRPRLNPLYPVIVLDGWTGPGRILGKDGTAIRYLLHIQMTVFSDNSKDPDRILQQCLENIRGDAAIYQGYGMYRTSPHISDSGPMAVENSTNIKSKSATVNFVYYAN